VVSVAAMKDMSDDSVEDAGEEPVGGEVPPADVAQGETPTA
jgi:hypothetical protein